MKLTLRSLFGALAVAFVPPDSTMTVTFPADTGIVTVTL